MRVTNRRRLTIRHLAALGAAMGLCVLGCRLPAPDGYRPPPQDTHEVLAMRLKDMSQAPPVSVEQATTEAAAQLAPTSQPAASLELSLDEVRASALASNLDLKVELVTPTIAEQSISEARARFEALLFGSLEHGRIDEPSSVVDGVPQEWSTTQGEAGLKVPLPTGGEITLSMPASYANDQQNTHGASQENGYAYDPVYDAGLKFSISQPLLRNAGFRANTHTIRVARYQRDIAGARTKLAAIRILANADRAYWLVYAGRRELEVVQQQHELALQQLSDARKRVAAGDSPEIEIMRAESGVASRLEAIIIARTSLRRRERDLKRMMNRADLPLNSPTTLVPTTDPDPVGLTLDAEGLADYAVAERMELLELELQLAIDDSSIDFERNAALPLFVLDYTYQTAGVGGSFHEAFRDTDGHRYGDHTLSLRAEIPLGNEAARSRVRRAMLERVQRLATREQRRLAIRQEVYDAVDGLEQDWQRILAARQEVVLAGRTYEAEKRQFEVGLRTSTDVLEAAARLASAQSREIQALAAYEVSQVDIAFACGVLLGQTGVTWEQTPSP
ncbi:MAG: TolC family protein [Phycisphaerae bacterium]|jgi:outer membrane protein TolC